MGTAIIEISYRCSGFYKTRERIEIGNSTSIGVVTPGFMKMLEVQGNALAVSDLARGSKLGSFVRAGRAMSPAISTFTKIAGTLGGIGILYGRYQYANKEISGLEFGMDTLVGGLAIVTSIFAAPVVATGFAVGALVYFGGKAIYEYSTGDTFYDKPIKN